MDPEPGGMPGPPHPSPLTHQAADGRPRMVDVAGKPETHRVARAEGRIRMAPRTVRALRENALPKGDPLRIAEIAGIQASKRTAELIPLCHPLGLTSVEVRLELDDATPGVRAEATVQVFGRTGVEMEALTAVSVALLTVYDMTKALDRGMQIEGIRLLEKAGGRSGAWTAPESSDDGVRT